MYRSLSLLVLIGSLSVVVSDYSRYSKYAARIRDGSTYEIDPFEGNLYETGGKNCTKPGPMCDGCETLYTCIQIGGSFIKEKLEDCEPGTCLESAAICTTGPNLACDDNVVGYNFTCHQIGTFPDPFNCQKYHLCLPDETGENSVTKSKVMKCSGIYYYDTRTTFCRKKLVNDTCPTIVPPCTGTGQTGGVPNNPALYYICLKGNGTIPFPNLFVCPDDQEFNVLTNSCVDPTPPSAAGPDGKCVKVGKFYDPASCLYYYDCTAVAAAPIRRLCETKMHFNHKLQKCEDFTCNDLDY